MTSAEFRDPGLAGAAPAEQQGPAMDAPPGIGHGTAPGSAADLAVRITTLLDLYPTRRAAAMTAGVSTDQITRYSQGRSSPPFEVLARLALRQGVSLDWLATGTGAMHRSPVTEAKGGLPVIGLTAVGTTGWYQPRTLGVRIPPPADPASLQPVAVLAIDDTLLPEGIRPGHVCFAFSGVDVLEGDLVYVTRTDGRVALRRYDGLPANQDRR
jgi:hypothetical protein